MAEPLKTFPVQLRRVGIAEISYECQAFGQPGVKLVENIDLTTGIGPYDAQTKSLIVFLTVASKPKPEGVKHTLKISVVGEFAIVDEAALPFPVEKLPQWAEKSGVAVLFPFLRELLFSVTQKSGFSPVMLPMIEVAPYRIQPPPAQPAPVTPKLAAG